MGILDYTPIGAFGNATGLYDLEKEVGDAFETPMRKGDPEFRDVHLWNYALPGGGGRAQRLQETAYGAQGRVAPQAQDSSFRAQQDTLGRMLMAQARGEQSLSQQQLRQATDRNIAQQLAMQASARPANAAMAARMASQNIGRANQGLAGQQAMAGIAERQAAAQAAAGLFGQARGQDIGLSQFNTQAQLQQRGMNDALMQALLQQELQNAALMQQGTMGYEQARTQRYGASLGVPTWGEAVAGAGGDLATLFGLG